MGQPTTDELRQEINKIFAKPELWLETENDQLGGRKPKELIDEGQGQKVSELLEAIKHGMVT